MTKRKRIRQIEVALQRKKDAIDAAEKLIVELGNDAITLKAELNNLIDKPKPKQTCGYCGQPDGYCGQC